jgi:ribosomal protein S18 acetylase RimI-like enzyme
MSSAVRPATVADAEAIARVHVATWQAAYAGLLPADYLAAMSDSVAQRAERWRTTLSTADATVLAVDADGVDAAVVGFLHVGPSRDEGASDDIGELHSIYVDPAHWAMGLGSALHDAGLAALLAGGHESATLWVLDTNQRARAFYERHGWSPDGSILQREIGGVTVTEVRYTTQLLG